MSSLTARLGIRPLLDVAALRRRVKTAIAPPCVALCSYWPSPALIRLTRRATETQLASEELRVIIAAVRRRRPCRFLVFGLGGDSLLWAKVNRRGATTFIEDSKAWFRRILSRHPGLKAHLVHYGTRRWEWEELLDSPERLSMSLPEEVERNEWDVVLVDAPAGFKDSNPGRMKSIALAARLARRPADVFVHDCDRRVEQAYTDHFLKPENLIAQVGRVRHYHLAAPDR